MRIAEIDFPSDVNAELGNLRTILVRCLHRADESVTAAKLLASTLGYTASVLGKIYKEDGIKSKSQEKRELKAAKEAKAAAKVTADLVKIAKAKLKKPSMRKALDPVQRLKRKPKK